MAFCGGRHFCVGALLAKVEIDIGANLILDTFDDIRFPTGYTPSDEGLFTRAPPSLLLELGAAGARVAEGQGPVISPS